MGEVLLDVPLVVSESGELQACKASPPAKPAASWRVCRRVYLKNLRSDTMTVEILIRCRLGGTNTRIGQLDGTLS